MTIYGDIQHLSLYSQFVLNNTNKVINIKGEIDPVYFETIEMELLTLYEMNLTEKLRIMNWLSTAVYQLKWILIAEPSS